MVQLSTGPDRPLAPGGPMTAPTMPSAAGSGPKRPPQMWIFAVIAVLGLLLGVFGITRLTATDPEVGRLEDQLAAVESDVSDARGDAEAITAGAEELAVAAQALDDSIVTLVDKLEAFADAERNVVITWNNLLATSGSIEEEHSRFDAEMVPAIDAAKTALNEMLEAFTSTLTSQTALQDALANEGG